MRMKNQVALVTGAASGIGKSIAQAYVADGAYVTVADLDRERAQAAARDIDANGDSTMAVEMDVTDEQAVEQGVEQTVSRFGGVDVLVSNAGAQHIDRVENLAYEDWQKIIDIHLHGAFLTTKACLRHMYAAQKGTVIYMGSIHSHEASPLKSPYVSAKHALLGLCRTVAKEGAEYGVRANVICPGFVRTPLVEKQIPEQAENLGISEDEVVSDVMLQGTVDGQFTTVEDISEMAVVLACYKTNALTGQSMLLTHGWGMQ
ncbi:3-hydroxybutyrate dehydrogenase [Salinisphaera sp. USBA-960]|uniref:3-hydroxybutyrate dehydrogenase n=1 Tax=Salinisphaera orenii TaxID=856731 RepID=UPI000DBE0A6C|nr:3-hydroxybutyrate dehydrogenase [Salifodinibacter halophilus]NNC25508.1 3-hydroxybutyrate dehydrogenase [Salifodinibacter halophilus]